MLPDFGRLSVEVGEAVGDRSAVQVDELGDTLGDPVGCARDNDPTPAPSQAPPTNTYVAIRKTSLASYPTPTIVP